MGFKEKYDYRTGTHCAYCGVEFSEEIIRTKDHVVPLSKWGRNNIINYIAACVKCNSDKGCLTLKQFIKKLEEDEDPRLYRVWKVFNKYRKLLGIKRHKNETI